MKKGETDEERLDRLEREEAELDAMDQLETKMVDANREMAIADASDEIRTRNARNERISKGGGGVVSVTQDTDNEAELEKERQEAEDEAAARKAFAQKPLIELADAETKEIEVLTDESIANNAEQASAQTEQSVEDSARKTVNENTLAMPPPMFKRGIKRKKDFGAALGIKRKISLV